MKIQYSWFNIECRRRLFFYASKSKYSTYSEEVKDWHWYIRNDFVREPVVWGVAFCVSDQVYNPFNGEKMPFSKDSLVYIILIVDVVTLLIAVFFFWLLERRTVQYIEIFDKRNVEMRDFSIRLGNLPYDIEYGGKDLMLQA